MASVCWGIRAWLMGHGGADWAVITSTAGMAFFGLGAVGNLLAALFTRQK